LTILLFTLNAGPSVHNASTGHELTLILNLKLFYPLCWVKSTTNICRLMLSHKTKVNNALELKL